MTQVTDKSAQLVLFEDIETALADLLEEQTIYSVEIFNSQTDFENEERPREYPFVMVDIAVEWLKKERHSSHMSLQNIKKKKQKGVATITVHCVFENLKDETTAFKETEPIRHQIHRAIDELDNEYYYTELIRTGSILNSSHDRVFDHMMTYSCEIIESALVDSTKETGSIDAVTITTDLIIDNETIRTGVDE